MQQTTHQTWNQLEPSSTCSVQMHHMKLLKKNLNAVSAIDFIGHTFVLCIGPPAAGSVFHIVH